MQFINKKNVFYFLSKHIKTKMMLWMFRSYNTMASFFTLIKKNVKAGFVQSVQPVLFPFKHAANYVMSGISDTGKYGTFSHVW